MSHNHPSGAFEYERSDGAFLCENMLLYINCKILRDIQDDDGNTIHAGTLFNYIEFNFVEFNMIASVISENGHKFKIKINCTII